MPRRVGAFTVITPMTTSTMVAPSPVVKVSNPVVDNAPAEEILAQAVRQHEDVIQSKKIQKDDTRRHVLIKTVAIFVIVVTTLISLAILAARHYNAEHSFLR